MRRIKSYKLFETIDNSDMKIKYGEEVIDKCDGVIEYIKQIMLNLEDLKFYCYVNYTPMTKAFREIDPILFVDISQNPEIPLSEKAKAELDYTIGFIKNYVESQNFFLSDHRYNDRDVEKYSMKFYPKFNATRSGASLT